MNNQPGYPPQWQPQPPQQPFNQWPAQEQPQWGGAPPVQQWPAQQAPQAFPSSSPQTQYNGPYSNYGPPQYPQQPMPPMYQPPQAKKKRGPLVLIIGIIAAVVLFACIGGAVIATRSLSSLSPISPLNPPDSKTIQNAQSTVTDILTKTTSQNTSIQSQHNKVGQAVKVGDTWQVTVNSASTSQGQDFSKPQAGNVYLLIDVTLKNVSSSTQAVSSLIMFKLSDATGQGYTEAITTFTKSPPDGQVAAGSQIRGTLVYEVPTAQHHFTFAFEPIVTSTGQTDWDINV